MNWRGTERAVQAFISQSVYKSAIWRQNRTCNTLLGKCNSSVSSFGNIYYFNTQ